MSNGNLIEQLRQLADRKELPPEQAMPLILAALADIYEDNRGTIIWRKMIDERVDRLESKDARVVAKWGFAGVAIGALLAVIGQVLIALFA